MLSDYDPRAFDTIIPKIIYHGFIYSFISLFWKIAKIRWSCNWTNWSNWICGPHLIPIKQYLYFFCIFTMFHCLTHHQMAVYSFNHPLVYLLSVCLLLMLLSSSSSPSPLPSPSSSSSLLLLLLSKWLLHHKCFQIQSNQFYDTHNTQVLHQCCGCWWPGASAPGHQQPQCWPIMPYLGYFAVCGIVIFISVYFLLSQGW